MRRRSIEDGDDGSEAEGGWLCSSSNMLKLVDMTKAYALLLFYSLF